MARQATQGRRVKVSVTLNPELLAAVDRHVCDHPGTDRSKVMDEALWLWCAREQERAMEEQFAGDSEVDPEEWESWRAIRRAAAERQLQKWDEK